MSKLSPLSDSEKVFVEALAGAFGGLAGAGPHCMNGAGTTPNAAHS